MADIDDVMTLVESLPVRPTRLRRWLRVGGFILFGCAACVMVLLLIPDQRYWQAIAIFEILDNSRCTAAARDVEVGWSYDQLKRRLGNRLSGGPPMGVGTATSNRTWMICTRPKSVSIYDEGVETTYTFVMDAQGRVVSISVAERRSRFD